MARVVARSEVMVENYGLSAVLISHTLLSPTCPYVSYVCGANSMRWRSFSLAAFSGASIWTLSLVLVGYYFSGRLSQLSDLLINIVMIIAAITVAYVLFRWLRIKWRDA